MGLLMVILSIAGSLARSCMQPGESSYSVCRRCTDGKRTLTKADHNIRVPKSDLDRINRTSILLEDEEGGHLVTIEAIHHLHCLNQLRQQIYHEYYYPDVSEWNSTKGFHHVDHCIDILRQVLMCQGDVSLLVSDNSMCASISG